MPRTPTVAPAAPRAADPPLAPARSPADADWLQRSRLRLRHLRLVVAIDEQGTLHRAAERLAMTQPAATRLLAELERQLGVRLFDRSPRGMTPTAFGDSLARHARTVLATLGHAGDELRALQEGAAGVVRVGVLLVAASVLVPRAVLRFKARFPRLTVRLREGMSAELVAALRRGEVDLIVGRAAADGDVAGLRVESFYSEPMVAVVRAGHPLARRRRLALADLADRTWVLPPPDAAYRRRLDAAFRQVGLEPPARRVESLLGLVNHTLLTDSDFVGVMPRDLARQHVAQGTLRVLPVTLPPPSGPVGWIAIAGRTPSPAAAAFAAALREAAAAT
jgi:DNA-binding transcriptional LysR family regulator